MNILTVLVATSGIVSTAIVTKLDGNEEQVSVPFESFTITTVYAPASVNAAALVTTTFGVDVVANGVPNAPALLYHS